MTRDAPSAARGDAARVAMVALSSRVRGLEGAAGARAPSRRRRWSGRPGTGGLTELTAGGRGADELKAERARREKAEAERKEALAAAEQLGAALEEVTRRLEEAVEGKQQLEEGDAADRAIVTKIESDLMEKYSACALKAAESASQATRLAQENAVLAGELQRAREANRAGGLQLGSAQEALAAARAEAQEATGWGAALEKELAELKADRDHEEMHTLEYTNKVVDIVKQAKETTRQQVLVAKGFLEKQVGAATDACEQLVQATVAQMEALDRRLGAAEKQVKALREQFGVMDSEKQEIVAKHEYSHSYLKGVMAHLQELTLQIQQQPPPAPKPTKKKAAAKAGAKRAAAPRRAAGAAGKGRAKPRAKGAESEGESEGGSDAGADEAREECVKLLALLELELEALQSDYHKTLHTLKTQGFAGNAEAMSAVQTQQVGAMTLHNLQGLLGSIEVKVQQVATLQRFIGSTPRRGGPAAGEEAEDE